MNAVASSRPDLRLFPAAAATWVGVLVGVGAPLWMLLAAVTGIALAVIVVVRVVG